MPRPNDPSVLATRAALLEAAILCFAEQGYQATGLRQVAKRAGRHVSLIAHHFGSKEGLYLASLREMLSKPRPGIYQGPVVGLEELREDPARAEAVLRELIVRNVLEVRSMFTSGDPRQLAFWRLWVDALRVPVPSVEPLVRERMAPVREQFSVCIQALHPDLPQEEIPTWFSLAYGQCLASSTLRDINQLFFGEGQATPPERLAEQVADLTLRALGRQVKG